MSLVAAAVVPTPPLLVPAVAGGSAAQDEELRAACRTAVDGLLASSPDLVVVVGAGPVTAEVTGEPDWRGLGVAGPPVERPLPLALGVGSWLLGAAGPAVLQQVSPDLAPTEAAALGAALVARAPRVAVLACGDGSARRDEKAPGHLDERAAPFDAAVTAALAAADPGALLRLDPDLARDLLVSGRSAWQVLAGAADGAGLRGEVTWSGAPYGVAYTVASWTAGSERGLGTTAGT